MNILQNSRGFTLIEIVVTMVILGILSAIAVPRIGDFIHNSKVITTKNEMRIIKRAVLGDPSINIAGQQADLGYYGEVGSLPPTSSDSAFFNAFITKPSGVNSWNKVTQTGWNGPYIRAEGADDWRKDAWGNYYTFDESDCTLVAPNDGSDIRLPFFD